MNGYTGILVEYVESNLGRCLSFENMISKVLQSLLNEGNNSGFTETLVWRVCIYFMSL